MAVKTLSDGFMQDMATAEAWKSLSGSFNWDEIMLEKYQDKVDWSEISKNENIRWTIPMMKKFQKRINWDKLSEYISKDSLTESMIEVFQNQWNWHELSDNRSITLTHGLLDKYADKWDWEMIINRHDGIFYRVGIDFYEKYKSYIPVGKLLNTNLWEGIVEQQKILLIDEITA